jgi:hypothetical protein
MMKRFNVVSRVNQTRWVPEKHDPVLRSLVKGGCDLHAIISEMGWSANTIRRKLKELGLEVGKRVTSPFVPHEKPVPPPPEKPNPIELGRHYIPGYNPETGCIHHEGNRIERLPIDALIVRLKRLGVM